MSKTKIEWTDATWNPIQGCSMVSKGCENCYAMHQAHRFGGELQPFDGLTKKTNSGVKWTGKIKLREEVLLTPIHWRKPRMIFVNSMSDLFHQDVPFEFIDKVMDTIMATPWHCYQILTKRPYNLVEYSKYSHQRHGIKLSDIKNLWLGVSVEDQETADERIPLLLQVPASTRFLSMEPLLGSVTLKQLHYEDIVMINCLSGNHGMTFPLKGLNNKIDWVIVGGESGHKARPMHPDWVKSIRDECEADNTPFFFKQWGEWREGSSYNHKRNIQHEIVLNDGRRFSNDNNKGPLSIPISEWQDGNPTVMSKVGKSKAGNLLDGKEYKAFPEGKEVLDEQ